MRKVIYICDKCGVETEDICKVNELTIEKGAALLFNKILCEECVNNVMKLINNNLMVIDPEDLGGE